MDILILGGGGREHVLARALTVSEYTTHVYTAPGNAGTAQCGTNVADLDITDANAVTAFCREHMIDLCIIESQQALQAGVADKLRASAIWVVGPGAEGVLLESSKVFAKEFMNKHGIPTAPFTFCISADEAHQYLEERASADESFEPVVIKPNGIISTSCHQYMTDGQVKDYAQERSVVVVAHTLTEAQDGVNTIFDLQKDQPADQQGVIIETYLSGREYSFTVLTDGSHMVPLKMAGVYRHLHDDKIAPLTDGMGAYCPVLSISDEDRQTIRELAQKTVEGIKQDNISFRGMLTLDVMVTDSGVYVLEYNVRCGSPQIQSIVPRMTSDPVEALVKCSEGRVNEINLYWNNLRVVTVVLTAEGYPAGQIKTGGVIEGIDKAWAMGRVNVYHEGTTRTDSGEYVVVGGRVLAITGMGDTFEEAVRRAYEAADCITFAGKHLRRDIVESE